MRIFIEREMKYRFGTVGIILLIYIQAMAQTHMRIHHKDGGRSDVPIEQIDSITFVESGQQQEATLLGSWMWGNSGKGYYEVLTFNEGNIYNAYDYYMEYGFGTQTYGTYVENGIRLNLYSNGYGYKRIYRWFVTGLTENALEVMTQMGQFIYYRVQPEVITIHIGEDIECDNNKSFIFADGVIASVVDNKLQGLTIGTTYVQIYNAKDDSIVSYKVVVE